MQENGKKLFQCVIEVLKIFSFKTSPHQEKPNLLPYQTCTRTVQDTKYNQI